jgi:hypothetical protein
LKRAYANRVGGHKRTSAERRARPSAPGREVQLPLDREELLGLMQDSLEGLAVELGLLVASAILEDEVTRLCGRRYERRPDRSHTRYGHQRGVATLAGQKLPIDRPRVRRADGGGEAALETYARLQADDAMPRAALRRMIRGVSTRDYAGVIDVARDGFGVAKSSESRFWRIDPKADYGPLDGLARQRISIPRIERNWDDLLRVAGSLKMGAVGASELIRGLQGGGRPSTLGRAIVELGRVAKTLYLLNYLDDEAYRRRILTQLNRGESRHSVARAIFHGQRGEVRQRYREGQEDQLGALGLVVNAVVLWNTRYLDAALTQVRATDVAVNPEDVERLSPLLLDHVNVLGRYEFALKDSVRQGQLRPLREPNERDDLAA